LAEPDRTPRVEIAGPDGVFAISADEAEQLSAELRLTKRERAPFDVAGAARKLETPGSEPVQFERAEAWATLRALDNLRNATPDFPQSLLSLRDALFVEMRFQPIAHDLRLVGDTIEESSLTTYSGRFEAGDRVLTPSGAWRVREVKRLKGGRERLTCVPYDAEG
jgi:hypothetical protein